MTYMKRKGLAQLTDKIETIRNQDIINKADVKELKSLKIKRGELLNKIISQWRW